MSKLNKVSKTDINWVLTPSIRNGTMVKGMIKALLLDCDYTVWDRKTEEVYDAAKQRLHSLPGYVRVAFCTNQTSVGSRYWMKKGGFGDPTKLKGEKAIRNLYNRIVQEELELRDAPIYMAFRKQGKGGTWGPAESDAPEWDKDWVKPGCGMLLQAMKDLGVTREEVVYIGDDSDEERPDSGAAKAAGVKFYKAPAIWGDESFWKGFGFTQQTMIEAPAMLEKDLSAFMDKNGKLSHAEIMANLERIAADPLKNAPDVLPTYGGREGAQRAAALAIANSPRSSAQPEVKKKRGKRR